MADFGGFQAVTPQEMLAQIAGIRDQAIASGDRDRVRQAIFGRASDALFGNKNVQDAQRLQQRIAGAMQQATQGAVEGEDPLDAETRRLKAIRDAVVDINPDIASQVNGKLLELANMKFQKTRLLAADAREVTKFNTDQAAAGRDAAVEKGMGGLAYVWDPKTDAMTAFDLLDPTTKDAFEKAKAAPGTVTITGEQAVSIIKDKRNDALRAKLQGAGEALGKNVTNDLFKQGAGLLGLYAVTDRVVNVLEKFPDAATNTATAAQALNQLQKEVSAGVNLSTGQITKDGSSVDTLLEQAGIARGRYRALALSLAYSLAQVNDSGGRLSDQDVKSAIDMVGSGNPAQMISNLNDFITSRQTALDEAIGVLPAENASTLAPMRNQLTTRRAAFLKQADKFVGGAGRRASGVEPGAKSSLEAEVENILNQGR